MDSREMQKNTTRSRAYTILQDQLNNPLTEAFMTLTDIVCIIQSCHIIEKYIFEQEAEGLSGFKNGSVLIGRIIVVLVDNFRV